MMKDEDSMTYVLRFKLLLLDAFQCYYSKMVFEHCYCKILLIKVTTLTLDTVSTL
jgi:hypothetical protein